MTVMLLEWVFTSIFLIMVVLALRAALGRRVSARLRYALWAVVLARLLVPVQLFTSPIAGTWVLIEKRTEQNVYTPAPMGSSSTGEGGAERLDGMDGPTAVLTTGPHWQFPEAPAVPDAPEPPAAPDLTKAPAWLGWVWLMGSIAVGFVLLASNLRFYWNLRRGRIPLDGTDCPLRVYAAVGLPSPCLFGIFRPTVYVTPDAAADPDMLRHVLAHEHTHYRHGDHIWSLLRCAALAVHWWNPLVWLSARLSQRDGELACDEGALKRLGEAERAGYGNTLLALVTAKPRPGDLFRCATTMAGDKKSLKERVSRIACAPKRWLWAAVAAVLVTALACVCAFGQAAEEPDKPAPDSAPSAPSVPSAPSASSAPAETEAPADVDLSALELSFSINERGDVAISAENSLLLGEDTYWHPAVDAEHPITYLALENPPYIAGNLEAWWWDDDSRASVMVHTAPTVNKFAGDDPNAGFWSFTVDLSKGVVTDMALLAAMPAQAEGTELHAYPETISNEEAVAVARLAAKLMTAAEDYYNNVLEPSTDEWVEHRVLLFVNPDLNRDGVPETIATSPFGDGMGMRVGIWQGADVRNYEAEWWKNADLLWTDEGDKAHAGWNAVFLCTLDGEDYLLRYHPTMYQGYCNYEYQLFTLENGRETLVRGNGVSFDINFNSRAHEGFDPEAIAAFMDEINSLLANSTLLLCTDSDLLSSFAASGRLYDGLWWLDSEELGIVRDESKSLLEALRDFRAAMNAEWYAEEPVLFPMNETEEGAHVLLRYKDKSTEFDVDWEWGFQPAESVEIQVLDVNHDGRDEIVFPLVWGHGTGTYIEKLYMFDADTLERYDTSGLTEMILGSIESAGDEENYYLSAPGMVRTAISKREAQEKNGDVPVADALNLGNIVEYSLQADGIHCRLGCDASGRTLNYIGCLDVTLGCSAGGGFRCVSAQYTPEQ